MPNPTFVASFPAWLNQCKAGLQSSGRTSHTSYVGQTWAFGLLADTMGNTLLPPNPLYPNCTADSASGNGLGNPGMVGFPAVTPAAPIS